MFLSADIWDMQGLRDELCVAKTLCLAHKFNGYIHLKTIPGASAELMQEAGLYADRLSVNVESQAAYSVFAKTLLEIFDGKNGLSGS